MSFNAAYAQLSPGDLTDAHKHLEGLTNCTSCHATGKQITSAKCLDCHQILNERIKAGKGLHANPEFKNCIQCHNEHHGRAYKLVYWKTGQDNFDHQKTGYTLEGAHVKLKCRDCHKADHIAEKALFREKQKRLDHTFLGLQQACLSCHHDEHRAQLGNDCRKCHNLDAWKPVPKFDHDNAKFRLTGKHEKVECVKCHPARTLPAVPGDKDYLKFTGLKFSNCTSCHKDQHTGQFGKDCRRCHNTGGWKKVAYANFDHDKTNFPLVGLHKKVECESCHKPGRPFKGIASQRCLDCHQDFHQGQFVSRASRGDCRECHTETGFSPSGFSMEKHQKTDFPLKGAHLAIPCIGCHSGGQPGPGPRRSMLVINKFTFKETRCLTCHNDVHRGQTEKVARAEECLYCHTNNSWAEVNFDHSVTGFKLEGKHAQTNCTGCHKPGKNFEGEPVVLFRNGQKICGDCHEDIHRGQFESTIIVAGNTKLSTDCSRCHTSTTFKNAEKFDHNKQARFALDGAHEKVPCIDCHPRETAGGKAFNRFKPVDPNCNSCHGGNRFGDKS